MIILYLLASFSYPNQKDKGEELKITAPLSRYYRSMVSAALDTRVSEEEQPIETRLCKLFAQINIWLLFHEFSE